MICGFLKGLIGVNCYPDNLIVASGKNDQKGNHYNGKNFYSQIILLEVISSFFQEKQQQLQQ